MFLRSDRNWAKKRVVSPVLRAGRAKAELGLPVHDAERETGQLQARRAWAQEAGLDLQGVEEVFRAVLRASRSAQGRG